MASSSLTNNLKDDSATSRSSETKKTLRWAADVVDNASIPQKAETDPKDAAGETANSASNSGEKKVKAAPSLCTFCGKNPACVRMKASWRGKDKKQSLCLLHYFTTSAVHADSEHVVVLDTTLVEGQLKGEDTIHKKNKLDVQDLFAEVFVQLQQALAQESLNISVGPAENNKTKKNKSAATRRPSREQDPLAIIDDLGRTTKKRKAPSVAAAPKRSQQGGFLKPVPVPERLKKTQEQQAKWQAEQLARMNRVAKTGQAGGDDTSKRRQPTRKSIWSTVIDSKKDKITNPFKPQNRKAHTTYHEIDLTVDDVTCSCGSDNVVDIGNVTSRNADVRKGEIWGSGDRSDDVVSRYRCNQCGKTWQEIG